MAERSERLAEAMAASGITDIEEGAQLLSASENVGMLAEALQMVGSEDVEVGLQLARVGGELAALRGVVETLNTPFLKPFLESRSKLLIDLGRQLMLSSVTKRALAGAARETAERIGELGENEIEEGREQLEASEEIGEEAAELREGAEELVTSAGGLGKAQRTSVGIAFR